MCGLRRKDVQVKKKSISFGACLKIFFITFLSIIFFFTHARPRVRLVGAHGAASSRRPQTWCPPPWSRGLSCVPGLKASMPNSSLLCCLPLKSMCAASAVVRRRCAASQEKKKIIRIKAMIFKKIPNVVEIQTGQAMPFAKFTYIWSHTKPILCTQE